MDEKSRKRSIYLIIILVIGFAGYQTIINYKPVKETDRHKNYVAGIQSSINASDSAYIEAFYRKLRFANIILSNDTLERIEYSNIDKRKLSKDFQPHICTKDYLDFVCGIVSKQNYKSDPRKKELLNSIDSYLGLGTFNTDVRNKNWSGSVKSEIKSIEKDQYLQVVDLSEISLPTFNDNTDSYISGFCKGEVHVVNINTGELVAAMSFFAKNDERIRSVHLVKPAMEDKLLKNLILNIQMELNKSTIAIFDKPLKAKETEVFE